MCLHSKNKWCSEGPYGALLVVPNTGHYSVLQGTPNEGASKDPMIRCTLGVLQRHPHIVALEHPVLTRRRLIAIYIIMWGPSGDLF